MPGFGAIGRFPIAVVTTGGAAQAEFIGPDKFWQNFSEPVRFKQGLASYQQRFIVDQNIFPIVSFGYYNWFSEPVRQKLGLRPEFQHFIEFQPFPIIKIDWWRALEEPVRALPRLQTGLHPFLFYQANTITVTPFNWFNWLTEPKRFVPTLLTGDQPFIAQDLPPPFTFSFDWFNWLSEPVRLPTGLRKELQRDEFFNSFIPIQYFARANIAELGDFLNAVLTQFAPPKQAIVTIVAPPGPPGLSSMILPNQPPLPGARVAIITTRGL